MMRLALVLLTLLGTSAVSAEKPNILVLLADDYRPDTIRALGHPDVLTPSLDKLVQQGTTFTRAHVMGSMQGAVCVPSRAMLLSGQSLYRVSEQLRDTPTWPQALRAAGYRTHMAGKWHNGPISLAASFPTAKTVFLGGMGDQYKVPLVDVGPEGKPTNRRVGEGHSTDLFVNEAEQFIKSQHEQKSRPWALYVAFTAPHDPRQAPERDRKLYDASRLALPRNFLPEHPFDNGELKIRDEKLETWPRTPEAIRGHLADYYAIITHLDRGIGRLLSLLDTLDLSRNTIVIFAGDNGLAIGSHGLMGKQNLYTHSAGVPLIIAGPGLPAGEKNESLCYLNDLAPTICELAGAKPTPGIGRSLLPALTKKDSQQREALLLAYRHVQRAVVDERWKLIWYPATERWQLFDLQADPDELTDLSTNPDHASTLKRMQKKLQELRKEFGDTKELAKVK